MTPFILVIALYFASIPEMTSPVADVWNTYLAGDFSGVSRQVHELTSSADINDRDKAILLLTLGCSAAMQGDSTIAAEEFTRSLEFYPDLGLTAADLPPPVWMIYHAVILKQPPENEDKLPIMEPVNSLKNYNLSGNDQNIVTTVPEQNQNESSLHNSSALKSVMFPGWGQLSEGRRSGKLIIATEIVLITGFIITAFQTSQARDDYLRARAPSIIEDRYNEYNNTYRLSWALGVAAAATYLLAQFDYFRGKNAEIVSFSYQPSYPISISFAL